VEKQFEGMRRIMIQFNRARENNQDNIRQVRFEVLGMKVGRIKI